MVCVEVGWTKTEVSAQTIRQTLLRSKINWKRAKHWVTSPDPQYPGKKPSGQRMRGRRYDRIRERLWSKSNKEKGHETRPKVSQCDQAVVSTPRARVLGVSSHVTGGGSGVQTDGDPAGRRD